MAPWQDKKSVIRRQKVVYCDDSILITRDENTAIMNNDLYILHKRVLPLKWKKY